MGKKVVSLSGVSIEDKLEQYLKLREESKTIKTQMEKLSKEIKDYAEENGVKDDKGSSYCDMNGYLFGRQAKKSISFIEDKALEFFKSHSLFDAIKTQEVIDESAVEKYIDDGKLTFDDLESITQTKVTYAIDLKKKEELPEVEETTVEMAASRKPKKPILKRK